MKKFKDLVPSQDCLYLVSPKTGFVSCCLIDNMTTKYGDVYFTYNGREGFAVDGNLETYYTRGMDYVFGTSVEACKKVIGDMYLRKIEALIKKRDKVLSY